MSGKGRSPRSDTPPMAGSSHSGSDNNTVSLDPSSSRRGGHLDPCNQLEIVYEKMVSGNTHVKEELLKTFKSIRILVVGKAGSGKTTLIRLLVGDKGPQSISHGNVGAQDILTEWRHPDSALPLVIHDSNGIDTAGNDRKSDIKNFLDQRLSHVTSADFDQRVHAVWYVFSGIDNRALDDGGLLEMLDGYGDNLPLLLIMTHYDKVDTDDQEEMEEMVGKLLDKIKNVNNRMKVKKSMVRLGNKVRWQNCVDGQVKLRAGSVTDLKGMKLVFERTKQLMDKNLWITWAACQAVDMNGKLEASAKLIVRSRKQQMWAASAVATLPVVQQMQLAAMFSSVTRGLTKIWNVSENFEKAITSRFLLEEMGHALSRNLAKNTLGALALAAAVALTVVTGGMAAPSILGAAAASAFTQVKSTSTVLMTYGLLVMGTILYVRTHHEKMVSSDNRESTVEEYKTLCNEFVVSTWGQRIMGFSDRYSSVWDMSLREKRQGEQLRAQLIDFFSSISLKRPKSLFSAMENDDAVTTTTESDGADVIDNRDAPDGGAED